MATRGFAAFLSTAVVCLVVSASQADAKRIALVVGNGTYQSLSSLKNTRKDAGAIARSLERAGFEVSRITDADLKTIKHAFLAFSRALQQQDVEATFFYYAGHGAQVRGENYLLPVDANISHEDEVAMESVALNDFLQILNHSKGRWWLVPWWAKEMPKQAMFNARLETVETSGAFKDAFKMKRCLIPADGFYEWTVNPGDGKKDPWFIFLPGHKPFSFAGLWARNDKLDVTSCTIITKPASEPMSKLHDRQPLILDTAQYDAWLDSATPAGDLKGLLGHEINGELQFHRVHRAVNASTIDKQRNDDPSMIEPVNPL